MKKFFPILFSFILTFLVIRPLFLGHWYPMHDSTHVARITLMSETIKNGQFPPLWADRAGNGYGYPLFHFYAPLFHLSTTLINFVLNDIYLSLKVVLTISTFLAIFGTYKLASRWGTIAGIIAATAFAFSPYLAVNIYVRGAFSEYLALSLSPWVFLSLTNLSNRKKVAQSAVIISLLVLSHNLMPIVLFPAILIWGIYFNRHQISKFIYVLILTGLLTSWFMLPVFFERGFTWTDNVARTTSYDLHFVELKQIWNSTWGFGGSGLGIEDGMSFKLGKLQIVLAAFGMLIAIYRKNILTLLIAVLALFFVWIATPYSKLFWDSFPYLQIIQFPWRALGPLAFTFALLAGYSSTFTKLKLVKIAFLIPVVALTIYLNLKYFVPLSYEDTSTKVENVIDAIPEYIPAGLKKYPAKPADPIPSKLYGPATVSLDRAYYPTWNATLDGQQVPLRSSVMGLVELDVPVGEHDFTLTQSRTQLQLIAFAITLFTLGLTIGFLRERA